MNQLEITFAKSEPKGVALEKAAPRHVRPLKRVRPSIVAGQRFVRLVTVSMKPTVDYPRQIRKWICKCDCGQITEVFANSLTSGNTRSCGCLWREMKGTTHVSHGMTHSQEYSSCH